MRKARRACLVIGVLLSCGLLAACGDTDDTSATATNGTATAYHKAGLVLLDDSYNNGSMEVSVGATVELTLKANPTTGYEWRITSSGEPVLKQEGEPVYRPDSYDPEITGSGGEYTWSFKVAAAGQTKLKLVYNRPWEEEPTPGNSFQISIDARDS